MYAERIQIINYGPISQLDIEFPFDGDVPKPVVLVGANGSGQSILLSHIVNGLVSAKDRTYPETPEVETGKVFKIRSGFYIRSGNLCSFARVDLEDGLFMSEVVLAREKSEYETVPAELDGGHAKAAWDQMQPHQPSHLSSNILSMDPSKLREIFARNCVLYFPPNRFEQPAWLNEQNLNSRAEYLDLTNTQGYTDRRIINYSSLREDQNWLFEVAYDQHVFEAVTEAVLQASPDGGGRLLQREAIVGHSGTATDLFNVAIAVIRRLIRTSEGARFGIAPRRNRVVSLESDTGTIVPNIFQLSSGETLMLSMFLSILRDFDLSGAPIKTAGEARGIVVVDEVDLHLHAVHQHEVLPSLMRMFPKVQFIVTSHSPLFVLGMAQTYGEDGFALYRMPQGQPISPEEFTEFDAAYQAFTATSKFSDDIRIAVRDAQSPILYMEGKTDVQYLRRAAELLGQQAALQGIEIDEREGSGNLKKIWAAVKNLPGSLVPRRVLLLHDCDYSGPNEAKENRYRRKTPFQVGHPIGNGIENLFARSILEKALAHKAAFIDITPEHSITVRGQSQTITEKWTINEDEKTNLCDWLCANGGVEDFEHFQVIFDILGEVLGSHGNEPCNSA